MKKLICVLLILTVLPIAGGAAAEEEFYSPTYGTFYATRTRLYCGDQPDEYAYWTRNDTQKALLGIFLKDDFSLEDYHAYNHCFPYPACLLYYHAPENGQAKTLLFSTSPGTGTYPLNTTRLQVL